MMNKKTIVFMGNFIMPDKNALAVYYNSFAKIFKKLDYEIVFISWQKGIKDKQKTKYNNFDCYEMPYPNNLRNWFLSFFNSQIYIDCLKDIGLEKINAVIIKGIKSYNLRKVVSFCHKNSIKTVYNLVEWMKTPPDNQLTSMINLLDTWVEIYFLFPKIKNIICASKFACEHLNNKLNILNLPIFADKSADKWQNLNKYKPEEFIKIGYAGVISNINYKDRIDWLVKIASELNKNKKNIEIHIIGITKEEFQKYIKKLNLNVFNSSIIFYGKLSHLECIQILSQMDYNYIIREPNWNMKCGFPSKLIESYACGVPVLISDYSDINNYVQDGHTGWLLRKVSYVELKKLIINIMSIEKKQRIEMHNNCKKTVVLDYSQYIESVDNYFNNLL